jgi:tyrosyl-tRNA synthetase
MQGYDCVAMDVDLEIGGSDQLFNMLAGRSLMKALKKKDKFVLTMKLLTDSLGEKMGKSEGNAININCAPSDMFGQLMALPDNLLDLGIELLTDLPLKLIEELNPLKLKKEMAFDVVRQLHGDTKAKEAQKKFEQTFQEKKPDFEIVSVSSPVLLDIVTKYSESKSEAKRKIMQGAVDVNGKAETNPLIELENNANIKIGKKIFIKIQLDDDK